MIFLAILIAIKLFYFVGGILELRNVAVLVKNKAAVAFVDFITEVVAATFIAVVACTNLVAALCVLCTIIFGFVQCSELRNLVALNVVIVIYAVLLHNIDLTVMSRAEMFITCVRRSRRVLRSPSRRRSRRCGYDGVCSPCLPETRHPTRTPCRRQCTGDCHFRCRA